jgi:hypothetical protein
MFGSVVKSWAGCAVAIYFVSWMPQPAFTKALPPLSPFAISLSLQLPLFGVVLLTAKNRQATTRGVAFFAVAVVAMVLSTFSTTGPRVALLIAISILSGTLLIWASYRHWCNADLD